MLIHQSARRRGCDQTSPVYGPAALRHGLDRIHFCFGQKIVIPAKAGIQGAVLHAIDFFAVYGITPPCQGWNG